MSAGPSSTVTKLRKNLPATNEKSSSARIFSRRGFFPKAGAGNAADPFAQALRGVSAVPQEFTLDRKGGGQAIVEVRSQAMRIGGQDVILGIARDITERKKLGSQFLRAQRLESLGKLASGSGHDLNHI